MVITLGTLPRFEGIETQDYCVCMFAFGQLGTLPRFEGIETCDYNYHLTT